MKQELLKICWEQRLDREEQLRLFNETFHIDFTKEQWEQKHMQNPYVGSTENICLYYGDELIAFNMFMPQEYYAGGGKQLLLQSCESVVGEDWRGHGFLYKILTDAETLLNQKYGLIYGIPNEKSKRTFEKAGYRIKFPLDILVKVSKSPRTLKELMAGLLRRSRRETGRDEILGRLQRAANRTGKVKLSRQFPLDAGGAPVRDEIRLNRDERFYKWKVDANDSREFLYLYVEEEGKCKGYCVISLRTGGRLSGAEILDICLAEDECSTLKELLRVIHRACTLSKIVTPEGSRTAQLLKKMGFHIYKNSAAFLMYKVINGDRSLERIMEDKDWDFFFIEADTVFN